jgi:[ribosomal protein S5]-alanine N-acetyltransferase
MNLESDEVHHLRISLPAKLESERLVLRCYAIADAPVLAEMYRKNRERLKDDFAPRVARITDIAGAEAFILEKIRMWEKREAIHLGIWDKRSRMYAGEVCFKEIAWKIPKAEVGYYLAREFEGKGMATEALRMGLSLAFETLQMRKLQVRCSVDNLASQHVAERCGFKIEGILRNDFVKGDGRTLVSLVYYGMTPEDYRSLQLKPPPAEGFN